MNKSTNQTEKNNSNLLNIFNLVRDIPYSIPLDEKDSDNTCHGKSLLLYNLLKSYDYEARIRVCEFLWSDLPLPDAFKKCIKSDKGLHSFVEILINNEWMILDASFDKGLSPKLPVNFWDGESNTKLSVFPKRVFSVEESEKLILQLTSKSRIKSDSVENVELYRMLNKMYSHLRSL